MVKKLFYSYAKGKKCPWCGQKWVWTRARRSQARKYGEFDLVCRCGKQWKVIAKEEGFAYIEQ